MYEKPRVKISPQESSFLPEDNFLALAQDSEIRAECGDLTESGDRDQSTGQMKQLESMSMVNRKKGSVQG